MLIRLTEAQSAKRINDCICRERARTLACRFSHGTQALGIGKQRTDAPANALRRVQSNRNAPFKKVIAVALFLTRYWVHDHHGKAHSESFARGQSARLSNGKIGGVHQLVHAIGEAEDMAAHPLARSGARNHIVRVVAQRFVFSTHQRDAAIKIKVEQCAQRPSQIRNTDAAT